MVVQIELAKGMVALIDEEDWELVRGYRWRAFKGPTNNTWYALTSVRRDDGGQRGVYMHRLILGLTDPRIKSDHRDGNGLNNQRWNLRACANSENLRNRGAQANNKCGFKGVSWRKDCGKWRADIMADGKRKHLGHFKTPEEAHQAYCAAAIELHGEFANVG